MKNLNYISKYTLIALLASSINSYGNDNSRESQEVKKTTIFQKINAFTKFWCRKIKNDYPFTMISIVLLSVAAITYYRYSEANTNKLNLARLCIPDYDNLAHRFKKAAYQHEIQLNKSRPLFSNYEWRVSVNWERFYKIFPNCPQTLPELIKAHDRAGNKFFAFILLASAALACSAVALQELIKYFTKKSLVPEKNIQTPIIKISNINSEMIAKKT